MQNLSTKQLSQLNIVKASLGVVNAAAELLEITQDFKRQNQLIDQIEENIKDSLNAIHRINELQNSYVNPVFDNLLKQLS